MYHIEQKQWIPADIDKVWEFFCDPNNLKIITPPEMNFVVLSELQNAKEIYAGMLIDYTVSPLFHLKLKWQTEIEKVIPKTEFVDIQKSGPYKLWRHRHQFIPENGGILMLDHVDYALPLEPFGNLFHFIIRKKLDNIFAYRRKKIEEIFP